MQHTILEREQSSDGIRLAPLLLRQQFQLKERDFLLTMAELAGETMLCGLQLTAAETPWLPLHERELTQVESRYALGQENTLYLCAPTGSGRKTLLRRARS